MDYFKEYDLYEFPEYQKQKPQTLNMKQIENWLQERIERDVKLLNARTSPIVTDTDKDVTENIRTRLNTYIEVKSYLERGNMGH